MARLRFRDVEVFLAVMRSGTVREAARVLHMSQPAVSMALQNAEERLGLRLFERRRGRLHLTPEARALSELANTVVADLEDLERNVLRLREGQVGILGVAATPTLATAFLSRAVAETLAEQPGSQVLIRSVSTEEAVHLVARKQVDFALVYAPVVLANVVAEDIGAAEVACVVRHNHPLTTLAHVVPEDLLTYAIASYRPDVPLGQEITATLRREGAKLNIAVQASALHAAHLATLGMVALIDPFILVGNVFEQLAVRPFRPVIRARLQILTPSGQPLSRNAHDLLGRVRRLVPKHLLP